MGEQGQAGTDLNDQAIDWLIALDCGTADDQAFEAWRNSDPRHAAAFAQVAATWRRTADKRLSVMLEQPADMPRPAPAEPDLPAPRALTRRALAGGAVAAMIGVGAVGAFMAWPRRAYAQTAVGERRTVHLPDGSQALLNTDTRIAWRFDDGRDFWGERGEANLRVRGGGKPFRLYSDPLDARLSQGEFNLRLQPGGGHLLVIDGRAATIYRGTQAQMLQAGQTLTIADGAAHIAHMSADAMAATTAWRHGEIIFNGMALGQAVAEFNRYLPYRIELQTADLAPTQLGGTFETAQPDAFLLALDQGFGIAHRREGDRVLLFRRP